MAAKTMHAMQCDAAAPAGRPVRVAVGIRLGSGRRERQRGWGAREGSQATGLGDWECCASAMVWMDGLTPLMALGAWQMDMDVLLILWQIFTASDVVSAVACCIG